MKRVAVLMGGHSAEREVSLVSGREVAKGLRASGYDAYTVDVGHDLGALLGALDPRPDVVFNALHGRFGEDGCVQGVLELLRIPYTHSGVLASALAMDKPMAKRVLAAAGIRCVEGKEITSQMLDLGDPIARPYVVKPANEGSSVGVRIVRVGDNQPPRSADWRFGPRVLVERFVAGRELTVTVMGDRALAVTELEPLGAFYDYEAKYTEGKTRHVIPARIPEPDYREALDAALLAHKVLGCRGISRSDFRYDDTVGGEPARLYLLEVNTQPGMTPLSLVPEQAAYLGIPFPDLVRWMVENAQCDG